MVSPPSTVSTEIERTVGSQFDIDLTNVTQDSSLLKEDSQLAPGDTGLEMKHIHSTPAVKMRPFNNHDISDGSRNQNGDHSTDTSTLSSLSAPENGTHENRTHENRTHENGTHTEETFKPRAVAGELEKELKQEFEARWPRPARKGRSSRHRHRGSQKDGTRHHQEGIGKQDLVLSARGGNSQTDLASNDREGKEKGRRAGNQQSQGTVSCLFFLINLVCLALQFQSITLFGLMQNVTTRRFFKFVRTSHDAFDILPERVRFIQKIFKETPPACCHLLTTCLNSSNCYVKRQYPFCKGCFYLQTSNTVWVHHTHSFHILPSL